LDLARIVSGHTSGIEIIESAPVTSAFVQDRRPAQPGLRALENQQLE